MSLNNHSAKQEIKAMGCLKLCTGTRQVKVKNSEMNLTGLEFNLLNLLMIHSPDLLARGIIVEQLFHGAENKGQVINMHISNLRKKLKHCSSGLGIQAMRGLGYYLVVEY